VLETAQKFTIDDHKKEEPSHNKIRDMIDELGEYEGKVSEKEYRMDSMRLDVVWKKVPQGQPQVAFEVQIEGNIHQALSKLKYAHDLWNSTPVLVTTEQYKAGAKDLLEGSFHEIKDVTKIIKWEDVKKWLDLAQELYLLKFDMRMIFPE